MEAIKYSTEGSKVGPVTLTDKLFGVTANNENALLYEVINMYLANQRQRTASVKGRSEVRGSGAKMYRQKGTGNARAGSRRSPIRVGGGSAFGPLPLSRYKRIPKKKKRLALKLALTEKAASGSIFVIESLQFDKPNTKKAVSLINNIIHEDKRSLLIMANSDPNVINSFKNVPHVSSIRADSVCAYEILRSHYLIVTEKALDIIIDKFS